jgi:hypothetical protein
VVPPCNRSRGQERKPITKTKPSTSGKEDPDDAANHKTGNGAVLEAAATPWAATRAAPALACHLCPLQCGAST